MQTQTRYTGSAELCAAIRAAAEVAPETLARHLNPAHYELSYYWDHETRQHCDLHGPCLPIPNDERLEFRYRAGEALGCITCPNTRGRLLCLAEKIEKNRAAFDGKPPRRAPRPRVVQGSAAHVTARNLQSERDYAGALAVAQSAGAVFFGKPKPGETPILYMQPEELQAAGHPFTIARQVASGKFFVLHSRFALSAAGDFRSYSAARDWLESQAAEDAWCEKLRAACAKLAEFDQCEALALYAARSEPAEDAPEEPAEQRAPEQSAAPAEGAPNAPAEAAPRAEQPATHSEPEPAAPCYAFSETAPPATHSQPEQIIIRAGQVNESIRQLGREDYRRGDAMRSESSLVRAGLTRAEIEAYYVAYDDECAGHPPPQDRTSPPAERSAAPTHARRTQHVTTPRRRAYHHHAALQPGRRPGAHPPQARRRAVSHRPREPAPMSHRNVGRDIQPPATHS